MNLYELRIGDRLFVVDFNQLGTVALVSENGFTVRLADGRLVQYPFTSDSSAFH